MERLNRVTLKVITKSLGLSKIEQHQKVNYMNVFGHHFSCLYLTASNIVYHRLLSAASS